MKIQNKKPVYQQTFCAGLNRNIINAAENCDVNLVSGLLREKGIANNFQGDKVRAFCSLKIIELIDDLNSRFNINLGYPNAIITGDLAKNFGKQNSFGFCTFTPVKGKSGFICPEKTIFFNNSKADVREELETINKMADIDYKDGFNSSDNFLINFLHEFAHAIHEENLLRKHSGTKLTKKLQIWDTEKFKTEYKQKFSHLTSKICDYAGTNPLDTLACDLSGRLADSLNSNLKIENNILKNTPYSPQTLISRIRQHFTKNEIQSKDDLIKTIWNGNI